MEAAPCFKRKCYQQHHHSFQLHIGRPMICFSRFLIIIFALHLTSCEVLPSDAPPPPPLLVILCIVHARGTAFIPAFPLFMVVDFHRTFLLNRDLALSARWLLFTQQKVIKKSTSMRLVRLVPTTSTLEGTIIT